MEEVSYDAGISACERIAGGAGLRVVAREAREGQRVYNNRSGEWGPWDNEGLVTTDKVNDSDGHDRDG